MEAPFSVPIKNPLTLAVRINPRKNREHHFTSRVGTLAEGDEVFIRGPYGVPFTADPGNRMYLVGGGTGVAALASIAAHYDRLVTFIGAKTNDEILFYDRFRKGEVIPVTENEVVAVDGYKHGLVTDVFNNRSISGKSPKGTVVTCGPIPMMRKVVETAIRKGFEQDHIFAIMEPYMKCGVGICGSCSQYDGSIACTDGHILTADRFMESDRFRQVPEHRKLKRDATGAWERF
jgi:dihydroorotate dehydrogenase electron transfer subunit